MTLATAVAIAGGLAALPLVAQAAEIKVLSTLNIRPALNDLVAAYEQASGHKLTIESQGAKATRARIEAGDAADVVINSRQTLDSLLAQGRIRPGSITDIAHASIGVVVRAGAAKPDIASDDAFRSALLAAPSIAYPDPNQGSLGGNYLAALFERWGIAGQLQSKVKLAAGGAPAGRMVANGEAALGMNQVAEIMTVPGIEFLTPLPPVLVDKVTMSAAILVGARAPDAAAAYIKFLASPAAVSALQAHGMNR
jgi:molybdate transport system substrate-binding protein